jgi:hypothetical protein
MAPSVQVKPDSIEGMEFFGEADRKIDTTNGGKRVVSDYPAWMFGVQNQQDSDTISSLEREIDSGMVPEKNRPEAIANLKALKLRKRQIDESRLNLSDTQRDTFKKITKELGDSISEAMFTKDEEARGLANAHKEYERQINPCISLSKLPSGAAEIAKKLNCRISNDGEISRNDASRVWKILRAALGEDTNTERLRRR